MGTLAHVKRAMAAVVAAGAALMLITSSTAAAVPVLSTEVQSDAPPMRTHIPFPVCATDEQLDCLESIRVFRGGLELPVQLVDELRDDQSQWTYLDPSGEAIHLLVNSWAYLPGAVWVEVFRAVDAEHPRLILDPIACGAGQTLKCIEGHHMLPSDDRVRMTVRTSWLRFMAAGVQGHDMAFSRQPYRTGERFAISAKQNLLVIPTSWEGPVDAWVPRHYEARLYMSLTHAGTDATDSPFDPRCVGEGGPISAINAPNAGQPFWRSHLQSLEFGVYAPHLGPDGKRYVGNFEAKFPLAWLRCQASKPRLNLAGFEVQVWNENGEEQAATTSLRVRKGQVTVVATNFHYSSPRIVLTRK
jgi:hypothetical protein